VQCRCAVGRDASDKSIYMSVHPTACNCHDLRSVYGCWFP
jgi:hypothetical protein